MSEKAYWLNHYRICLEEAERALTKEMLRESASIIQGRIDNYRRWIAELEAPAMAAE